VIVDVVDGRPTVEWVSTTPKVPIKVLDVDVDGQTAETAQAEIAALVERESQPGAILFPRVHGTLSDGSLGSLGLGRWRSGAGSAASVHWDLGDAQSANTEDVGVEGDETRLEGETFHRLSEDATTTPVELAGPTGERRLKELFEALGSARSEGEAKSDYERLRLAAAYRALGLDDEERS
jgi:hypothetical protein